MLCPLQEFSSHMVIRENVRMEPLVLMVGPWWPRSTEHAMLAMLVSYNMCNESVSPLHPLWMANVLPQGCRGQLYATDTTVVFEASVWVWRMFRKRTRNTPKPSQLSFWLVILRCWFKSTASRLEWSHSLESLHEHKECVVFECWVRKPFRVAHMLIQSPQNVECDGSDLRSIAPNITIHHLTVCTGFASESMTQDRPSAARKMCHTSSSRANDLSLGPTVNPDEQSDPWTSQWTARHGTALSSLPLVWCSQLAIVRPWTTRKHDKTNDIRFLTNLECSMLKSNSLSTLCQLYQSLSIYTFKIFQIMLRPWPQPAPNRLHRCEFPHGEHRPRQHGSTSQLVWCAEARWQNVTNSCLHRILAFIKHHQTFLQASHIIHILTLVMYSIVAALQDLSSLQTFWNNSCNSSTTKLQPEFFFPAPLRFWLHWCQDDLHLFASAAQT